MMEFEGSTVADAIKATGAKKSGKLLLVPFEAVTVIPGNNIRIAEGEQYEADIEDLKQSILIEGFYDSKPLSCFAAIVDGEPQMVVIDGHRRYEAVKRAIAEGATIEELPVVLKKPSSTAIDLTVAQIKENSYVGLSMLEKAINAGRLIKGGLSDEDVGARLNISARAVSDLKVLIGAPKAIRDLVRDNKLSGTEAITRLRKDPEGAAEKLVEVAEKAEKKATERGERSARLTKSTIENDAEPAVKMQTYRSNFQVTAGATFMYEDAEPYLRVIGDETWFKKARKQTERIALETIEVEVKVRRPKSAEEAAAEVEVQETAPRKRRGKAAPEPEPEATDDGGLDDAGLGDDAPDLAALGIAERAGADAGL